MELENLDTSEAPWKEVRTSNLRPVDGVVAEGFHSIVYECSFENVRYSLARFYLYDVELFRAWGVVTEEHCSFHRYRNVDDSWGGTKKGCPSFSIDVKHSKLSIGSQEDAILYPITIRT